MNTTDTREEKKITSAFLVMKKATEDGILRDKTLHPMIGCFKKDGSHHVVCVTHGGIESIATAAFVSRIGYRPDTICVSHGSASATVDTNPLTGKPWTSEEIVNVLVMDGGLGVIKKNLTAHVVIEGCYGSATIHQDLDILPDGELKWGDCFLQEKNEDGTPTDDGSFLPYLEELMDDPTSAIGMILGEEEMTSGVAGMIERNLSGTGILDDCTTTDLLRALGYRVIVSD